MGERYILDDAGNPVAEPDLMKWAQWMEEGNRRVALTEEGDWRVSTVFLALDHNFAGRGEPVLWETMVFGGPLADEMDRYTSRESAVDGHEKMVARVRDAVAKAKGE